MSATPPGLVARLLKQLEQRGLSVEPGPEPGVLLLCGPAAEKTPDIVKAVKAFKPELLKLFAPRVAGPSGSPPAPEGER